MSEDVIGRVRLEGVRLSFADIWKPKTFNRPDGTQSDPKFSANFLLPKEALDDGSLKAVYMKKRMPAKQALLKAKDDAMKKRLGEDGFQKAKLKPENFCVKDGDLESWDGYEGARYVSSNNKKQPKVVGKDKRPVTEAEGVLYSGCYVNAVVTLWCQQPGKNADGSPKPLGVFASLEAIQFVKDGEAFGAKPVDPDAAFEDISDDDEDEEVEGEESGGDGDGDDGSGLL